MMMMDPSFAVLLWSFLSVAVRGDVGVITAFLTWTSAENVHPLLALIASAKLLMLTGSALLVKSNHLMLQFSGLL